MDGLHGRWVTPQYGFSREMKEFEQAEYDATVSKLSNNLICMNPVDMLDKKRITSDVYINALSYQVFLKRKMTGAVKTRTCTKGRLQQEFIMKEMSLPNVSTYTLFISCASVERAFLKRELKTSTCFLESFMEILIKSRAIPGIIEGDIHIMVATNTYLDKGIDC